MSTENTVSRTDPAEAGVVAKLSTVDRFLPIWILAAMTVGLLVMMYPVLAKVRYDRLDTVTGDRRLLVSSLVLCPAGSACPPRGSTCPHGPSSAPC